MLDILARLRLFVIIGIGLSFLGPVQAQDDSVHGMVQSVSGQTVTVQLKDGYRVESGTEGKVFTTRKAFADFRHPRWRPGVGQRYTLINIVQLLHV